MPFSPPPLPSDSLLYTLILSFFSFLLLLLDFIHYLLKALKLQLLCCGLRKSYCSTTRRKLIVWCHEKRFEQHKGIKAPHFSESFSFLFLLLFIFYFLRNNT